MKSHKKKHNKLLIRTDIVHAYRVDTRSPSEIRTANGFSPSATSTLGVVSEFLDIGSAFCAGECLDKSIPLGKRIITPEQAFSSLKGAVGIPSYSLHIYYINLVNVRVVRYLENVGIYTSENSHSNISKYTKEGPMRILRTSHNMDENYSETDISFNTIKGRIYDYPLRAWERASFGELYIMDKIPMQRILYGGSGVNLSPKWLSF